MLTTNQHSGLPNFLVIGAAKAGTTSLYHYLRQHPGIFMSADKEPRFLALGEQPWPFLNDGGAGRNIVNLAGYRALFAPARSDQVTGEASVIYMYMERTIGRIRELIPRAKFIAILRQPADRAFSHHAMMRRGGVEPLDFEHALAAENARVAARWHPAFHYRRRGNYFEQLSRYYANFGKTSIKIILHDDLVTDPGAVLAELLDFLEVDSAFKADVAARHNEGGLAPRNMRVYSALLRLRQRVPRLPAMPALRKLARTLTLFPVALSQDLRKRLTADYRDGILRLGDLIDRDLSIWLL